jgi:hypothetical protein
MHQTQLVKETLTALGLPVSVEGLVRALEIIDSKKVLSTKILDGDFKGCFDTERIESEFLPKVLENYPKIKSLVQAVQEEGEGLTYICTVLNWSLENVYLLGGNRPLPFDTGVSVKNFKHKDLKFGILFWLETQCLVKSFNEEEQSYKTVFCAFMDGWLVD